MQRSGSIELNWIDDTDLLQLSGSGVCYIWRVDRAVPGFAELWENVIAEIQTGFAPMLNHIIDARARTQIVDIVSTALATHCLGFYSARYGWEGDDADV